jgi:hypothetical protein
MGERLIESRPLCFDASDFIRIDSRWREIRNYCNIRYLGFIDCLIMYLYRL